MTQEHAFGKLLEARTLVLASFERKAWVEVSHVAQYLDRSVLMVLEEHGLIEVKGGNVAATTFRVKAAGYKLALQYK